MKKGIFAIALCAVVLTVLSAPGYCVQPMPKKPVPQHEHKIIRGHRVCHHHMHRHHYYHNDDNDEILRIGNFSIRYNP